MQRIVEWQGRWWWLMELLRTSLFWLHNQWISLSGKMPLCCFLSTSLSTTKNLRQMILFRRTSPSTITLILLLTLSQVLPPILAPLLHLSAVLSIVILFALPRTMPDLGFPFSSVVARQSQNYLPCILARTSSLAPSNLI